MRSRGSAAMGGVYAGALLGTLAGGVEGILFLEGPNLSATPGSSLLFLLLSASLYAVLMGVVGALIGWLASFLRRKRATLFSQAMCLP